MQTVFDVLIVIISGILVNYLTELLKSLNIIKTTGNTLNTIVVGITTIIWVLLIIFKKRYGKHEKKKNTKERTKMITSIRDELLNLEVRTLRSVYGYCMSNNYHSENWLDATKNRIINKQNGNSAHKSNYQINTAITPFGLDALDVTTLCTLIYYDFNNYVYIGDQQDFKEHISKIRTDKNMIESHISEVTPRLEYFCGVLNALNNLSVFINYIKEFVSDEEFLREINKISKDLDTQILRWSNEFHEEFSDDDPEMAIIKEMQRLVSIMDEENNDYIPLSYDELNAISKDIDLMKDIDEVFFDRLPSGGLAIIADAGYGKSWALRRIAGLLADRYLKNEATVEDHKLLPVFIELGVTTESDILKIVEDRFSLKDERQARDFIKTTHICFIVDAFDEARDDVRENISDKLREYRHYENIKILCSARGTENRRFIPQDLPIYSIFELTDNKLKLFFDKLENEDQRSLANKIWFEGHNTEALKACKNAFTVSCFVDLIRLGNANDNYCTDDQIIFDLMKSLIRREIGVSERKIENKIGKSALICTEAEVEQFLILADDIIGLNSFINANEFYQQMENRLFVEKGHSDAVQIARSMVQTGIMRRPNDLSIGFRHKKFRDVVNRFEKESKEVGI